MLWAPAAFPSVSSGGIQTGKSRSVSKAAQLRSDGEILRGGVEG